MRNYRINLFSGNMILAGIFAFFSFHVSAQGDLALQGILDFSISGTGGKAVHVVATADIADMSVYGIGVANNGGGTDGQEYTFPAVSATAGDHILVAAQPDAMTAYLASECVAEFSAMLEGNSSISMNGDDAIELFGGGVVIETFGDIDTDGSGEYWEYLDSWAYKVEGSWTYGAVNCTDGSSNSAESNCPYPFCPVPDEIFGCMDDSAFNYNPNATVDDGSCEDVLVDCMDWDADNYNSEANTACEDCCIFSGCMDSEALNYDSGANNDDGSCIYDSGDLSNALALQGILDFTVPEGGNNGKAIHLRAVADVEDISIFGVGVANNGGGTDGQEYTLPALSVVAGDDIFIIRSEAAMTAYLGECYAEFEHVVDGNGAISMNGDDAIELFEEGIAIELFGDLDTDGSGEEWDYLDSWAYKVDGAWTYGGVNCTDGSANTMESSCPYPMCLPQDVLGCTDGFYMEFDPLANADDGSCATLKVWGCTYESASNYNPQANIDNGSCELQASNTCPSDLDGDGAVATSDLLAFLAAFGLDCD